MIRKCAAALVALVIAVGSIFADEVKGVFVKFADGTLTLKVDDKDKEFKIPADLKVKRKFKGEEKEFEVTKMLESKFMKEGVTKLTVVTEGDKVTDVKVERKGKGK
jgi:ketosteroid isomerase-like protein